LLEVLIALLIAGLAIAALLQAGAAGLGATRAATRYEEAVARARSHLDAATHSGTLGPRDNRGDDGGGFHWRLRVAPIASTTIQRAGVVQRTGATVTLYSVTVWIFWGDGNSQRNVRLDTEQIGAGAR
jgi:general secretion pathway protein I